jgi:hypothetical protein
VPELRGRGFPKRLRRTFDHVFAAAATVHPGYMLATRRRTARRPPTRMPNIAANGRSVNSLVTDDPDMCDLQGHLERPLERA